MKTKVFKFAMLAPLAIFLLLSISCKDDDPVITPDDPIGMQDPEPEPEPEPEPTAEEVLASERQDNISIITASNEKVWRIESAQLKNVYGEFDVSANFNIKDDELIFKNTPSQTSKSFTEFEGTLEWRRNNRLNEFAETQEETLVDDYLSPAILSFDFKENSSSTITTPEAEFEFSVNASGKIEGTIVYEDAVDDLTTLDVVLTEKLASDYKQVPSGTLVFTEAFTFQSDRVDSGAVGMAGSLANNSFYIALRDITPDGSSNAERVIKFDLNTGNQTNAYTTINDFVTKQPVFYNGRLLVAGGQRVNTYDVNISNPGTPGTDYATSSGVAGLGLSRFGVSVANQTIYLVGGNLNSTSGDVNSANQIYAYDILSQGTSLLTSMPAPRFGARSEIVNDKLYAFGGTVEFFTPPATNTIFIYDFASQSFTTETMPQALDLTYVDKIENLIYVAGRIDTYDTEGARTNREPYLGVYDTNSGTFTELATDLASPDLETIHSMAVFDGKIYIVYGQGNPVDGQIQTWSILAADI